MTQQLDKWAGDFGDAYSARCRATEDAITERKRAWQRILRHVESVDSVLEVGCNVGINLHALADLLPDAYLEGVEPNERAAAIANDALPDSLIRGGESVFTMPDLYSDGLFQMVFTTGVLIHVAPDDLLTACTNIVNASQRYVYCQEYFSQHPREITYRGKRDMLWARDFGSFYMDNFPQLRCVTSGFFWKRTTGLDDVTYWLFEKTE